MGKYDVGKEKARQEAINWQNEFAENPHCWKEVAEKCTFFEKLGQRFGLIQEFRENGIL